MSGQHTPGPWAIVEDRSPSSLEVFGGGAAIAELWRRADVVKEKADSRLIAAAPELLEALEALCARLPCKAKSPNAYDCYHARVELDAARAVIAKATGEQP